MKILVREYNDNETLYVWKKIGNVFPIGRGEYRTENNEVYTKDEIIKITNDYRTSKFDYVVCGNCGKVIKRSEMTEHFEESERDANCMKCDWLRLKATSENKKNRLLKDGMVAVTTIYNPYCSEYSWNSGTKISEMDKYRGCKFYKCRRTGVRELYHDYLFEYPNPYQKLLTEKMIISAGWTYTEAHGSGRIYSCCNNLSACFDTNGILVNFIFYRRGNEHNFTYSDKYDKFFDRFGEFDWEGAAERTIKSMEKKIRKLYKESEEN